MTDNGTQYKGSAIQSYSCRKSNQVMGDSAHCIVRGEAVVVKIGNRGDLFMVLDKPGARSSTEMAWSVLGAVSKDPMTATQDTLPYSWNLSPEQMPLFVRFKDSSNPYSVEAVDPRHLEAFFGPGVKLLSVTVRKTAHPIRYGIVERELPWIYEQPNPFQHDSNQNPLSETFSYTNFILRDRK